MTPRTLVFPFPCEYTFAEEGTKYCCTGRRRERRKWPCFFFFLFFFSRFGSRCPLCNSGLVQTDEGHAWGHITYVRESSCPSSWSCDWERCSSNMLAIHKTVPPNFLCRPFEHLSSKRSNALLQLSCLMIMFRRWSSWFRLTNYEVSLVGYDNSR